MKVYDFAMEMELDGKDYYEKLAGDTTDIGLKSIFTSLASDEQKHYEMIQSLKSGMKLKMTDTAVLENAKNLFERLRSDKSIAGGLKKSLDGYEHARKIEADSIKFYEEMATKEDDPETVQVLLKIVIEEKKHFSILDNLCDFVQAPLSYLAWGEFSNLKEL